MATTSMINTSILIGDIKEENKEQIEKISNAMARLYKEKYPILKTTLPEQIQQKIRALDNFIKKQNKYKGVVKEDYDSNTYRSAILAVRLVLNSESSAKLKEQALDLYGILRPSLEKEKVKNLPLPYPPSVVSKTYDEKLPESEVKKSQPYFPKLTVPSTTNLEEIQKHREQTFKSKVKPISDVALISSLSKSEKALSKLHGEIIKYIEGDKTIPGTYYISERWGSILLSKIKSYNDHWDAYQLNLTKAKKRDLIGDGSEKFNPNTKLKEKSFYEKFRTCAENSMKIEATLDLMKSQLAGAKFNEKNAIVLNLTNTLRSYITDKSNDLEGYGNPLLRKFSLEDRTYLHDLNLSLKSRDKNNNIISDEISSFVYDGTIKEGSLDYLELQIRLSSNEKFINSKFVLSMEDTTLLARQNYGDENLEIFLKSFKSLSLPAQYELSKHFNNSFPPNFKDYLLVVRGMSTMGYDSSAHVLKEHSKNLYNVFSNQDSKNVMSIISAETIKFERACEYTKLYGYITSEITEAYIKSKEFIAPLVQKKIYGPEGITNRYAVGPIESRFKKDQSATSADAWVTMVISGWRETQDYKGVEFLIPPNLSKSNPYMTLSTYEQMYSRSFGRKVGFTLFPPTESDRFSALAIDLNGFRSSQRLPTSLDSVETDLDMMLRKVQNENTTEEGNKTTNVDKSTLVSGSVIGRGETSELSGTVTRAETISKTETETSGDTTKSYKESQKWNFDVGLENIFGVSGFVQGELNYLPTEETNDVEMLLNDKTTTKTFGNSDVVVYLRNKGVTKLDSNGKAINENEESLIEAQIFIKTAGIAKGGYIYAGTEQLNPNASNYYTEVSKKLTNNSLIYGGHSGIFVYGNTEDKNVLDQLKNNAKLVSNIKGETEVATMGGGAGVQINEFGAGATYEGVVKGADRGLGFLLWNGVKYKGTIAAIFNAPESQTTEQEKLAKDPIDQLKQEIEEKRIVTIIKDRPMTMKEILKEQTKNVGIHNVNLIKIDDGKNGQVLNENFFQFKRNYNDFYAGTRAKGIANNVLFGSSLTLETPIKDESETKTQVGATGYISNEDLTKFALLQSYFTDKKVDALTAGLVYKSIFGWDIDFKGFGSHADKQSTTYGVQVDIWNSRIVLHSLGGKVYEDSEVYSDGSNNFFSVIGGVVAPSTYLPGLSTEADWIMKGPYGSGMLVNPQFVSSEKGFGVGLHTVFTEDLLTLTPYFNLTNESFSNLFYFTYIRENKEGTTLSDAEKRNKIRDKYFEGIINIEQSQAGEYLRKDRSTVEEQTYKFNRQTIEFGDFFMYYTENYFDKIFLSQVNTFQWDENYISYLGGLQLGFSAVLKDPRYQTNFFTELIAYHRNETKKASENPLKVTEITSNLGFNFYLLSTGAGTFIFTATGGLKYREQGDSKGTKEKEIGLQGLLNFKWNY